MRVPVTPCDSCPYRRRHPSGVWHESEYAKLRKYDDNTATGLFLCHQSTAAKEELVCRGWLTVHCESVAARLAVLRGQLTVQQLYAKVRVALFKTGAEAAEHGIARLKKPGRAAKQMAAKLYRRRIAKR